MAAVTTDIGPVYSRGRRYRARAEARQREFRATVLRVKHGRYGHWLAEEAANQGRNFVVPDAFEAAQARQQAGKGVARRTFDNMLSSQAMCFNLFAPMTSRLDLAARVLEPFIPGLEEVTAIHIEHTPAGDIFNDQSGRGGVDCDVLIEARTDKGKLVQVVETKFVEREFSVCGFRKPGRANKGQDVCPDDAGVRENRSACLYVRNKGYSYWRRSDEHDLFVPGAVPERGCPFSGVQWQLWVNLALAHEEAVRRGAPVARFGVCASSRNTALLEDGQLLDEFRSLLREPDTFSFFDLDDLVTRVQLCAPPGLAEWGDGLAARYANI